MEHKNPTIHKLAAQIKKNPGDSFSKFALALELLKKDQLSQARVLFEDIYRRDPDYIGIYYHLGKLYEQLNRFPDAQKMYQEGIKKAEEQGEKRTLHELKEALTVLNIELDN